jgi:hypothetical protein
MVLYRRHLVPSPVHSWACGGIAQIGMVVPGISNLVSCKSGFFFCNLAAFRLFFPFLEGQAEVSALPGKPFQQEKGGIQTRLL